MLCSKLIINTPKWNHVPINWKTVDFEHAFAGILCTACKCMFKVSDINTTLRSLIDVLFVSLLSTLNILIRNINLANIYLFKVNNRNSTKRCEICSKLTIKIPKRRQRCCSGIFIVKFEHITHLFLCFYCWFWTSRCLLGDVVLVSLLSLSTLSTLSTLS